MPVYAVADEEEAKALIVLACPTNGRGQYIAPELAQEQTLENLDLFSERLDRAHEFLKSKGHCRCHTTPERVPVKRTRRKKSDV